MLRNRGLYSRVPANAFLSKFLNGQSSGAASYRESCFTGTTLYQPAASA
jgi:hypothetical protein